MDTLYRREFIVKNAYDENRTYDGIRLRYQFGAEECVGRSEINSAFREHPCSILELMVALSLRCENQIMSDYDVGDRTPMWFWCMINSLGLIDFFDIRFDPIEVNNILDIFLRREYQKNGRGGLFTVEDSSLVDMRSVEIWYQMCWFLNEHIEKEEKKCSRKW